MQRTGTRRRPFNGRSAEGIGIDVEDRNKKKSMVEEQRGLADAEDRDKKKTVQW